MPFDPTRLLLSSMPSVALGEHHMLPECQGIYFATIPDGTVLYIGKAKCLLDRWKHHHRLVDLSRWSGVTISWLRFEGDGVLLLEIERACIRHFSPVLNGSSVGYAETVKRSFTFPPDLYLELVRIANKEDRTVNAQVVRWLEQKVREYKAQEQPGDEPGQWVPESLELMEA